MLFMVNDKKAGSSEPPPHITKQFGYTVTGSTPLTQNQYIYTKPW
jgi:hypothetical protein